MVKKTLIYSIAVVLSVFLVLNAVKSGLIEYADAKIEIANNAAMDAEMDAEVGLDQQLGGSMGGSMGGSTSTPSAGDTSSDSTAQTPSDGGSTDAGTPNNGGSTDSGAANQNSGPVKPQDGIPTLEYYNSVISKAVDAKVGYNKTRTTDNEKMEGSVALQAMKGLVYKFMGIGAENTYTEKVEKGKWGDVAFLAKSKLAASDVTAATCTESGANYVITLKLKSGSSSAGKSNPTTPANAALDKCGICVGAEDKGYFDHKTASVIYDAIAGTYAGAEIKENYTNATVVATVDAKTGNLVSLVVEWNQAATLSKLAGMSATASGVSHVTYKDFKY